MNKPNHTGRKPAPERRAALREALIDYVLQHGIADLSLRPLAEALGTSTYALVYHFGSKEEVLTVALTGAEERLRGIVASWIDDAVPLPPADLLRRLWGFFTTDDLMAYNRLFFEVYGLALRDPTQVPGFLDNAAAPWGRIIREIIERNGFDAPTASAMATLISAIANGLQLDLLAFNDQARTARALDLGATMLAQWVTTETTR